MDFITEGIPLLTFGVVIQLDTMAGVAWDDTPRLVAANMDWAYIAGRTALLLLPFAPLPAPASLRAALALMAATNGVDLAKLLVMESWNVVGLLSSSFQPANASSCLAQPCLVL